MQNVCMLFTTHDHFPNPSSTHFLSTSYRNVCKLLLNERARAPNPACGLPEHCDKRSSSTSQPHHSYHPPPTPFPTQPAVQVFLSGRDSGGLYIAVIVNGLLALGGKQMGEKM